MKKWEKEIILGQKLDFIEAILLEVCDYFQSKASIKLETKQKISTFKSGYNHPLIYTGPKKGRKYIDALFNHHLAYSLTGY